MSKDKDKDRELNKARQAEVQDSAADLGIASCASKGNAILARCQLTSFRVDGLTVPMMTEEHGSISPRQLLRPVHQCCGPLNWRPAAPWRLGGYETFVQGARCKVLGCDEQRGAAGSRFGAEADCRRLQA